MFLCEGQGSGSPGVGLSVSIVAFFGAALSRTYLLSLLYLGLYYPLFLKYIYIYIGIVRYYERTIDGEREEEVVIQADKGGPGGRGRGVAHMHVEHTEHNAHRSTNTQWE